MYFETRVDRFLFQRNPRNELNSNRISGPKDLGSKEFVFTLWGLKPGTGNTPALEGSCYSY